MVMSAINTRPRFISEPEDQYIVKNKPAFLTCEVQNATEVLFKCNRQWLGRGTIHSNKVIRDAETGTETTRIVLKVTRYDVNTFFSPQNYWCRCVVWNKTGRVKSKKARVKVAYLGRNFRLNPLGRKLLVGEHVKLSCVPPIGVPVPTVYWMKNELRLRPSPTSNFRMTEEGRSLVIRTWGVEDSGNYTCVAKNIASTRRSSSALIRVSVNGNWNEWSSWSACDANCGLGHSQRNRSCTNPAPSNGGASCRGEDKQLKSCTTICPVNGGWTDWSSWSTCSPTCLQRRRRTCSKPLPQDSGRPCPGLDLESKQCAWELCSGPSNAMQESVFAGLLLFLIFLFAALIFFKCKKRRIASKQQMPFHCFTNANSQPDLIFHHHSVPTSSSKYLNGNYACKAWTSSEEKHPGLLRLVLPNVFVKDYPSTANIDHDMKNERNSTEGGAKEQVSRRLRTWTPVAMQPVDVALHEESIKSTTL